MKVLITGIAGFVGSHLAELLLNKENIALFGMDGQTADIANIRHIKNKLKLYQACDIKDRPSVKRLLKRTKPDCVVHLAAQSSPVLSEEYPEQTVAVNIIGVSNIFEALSDLKLKPRVVIAGSCDEYGHVSRKEMPIKEACRLKADNLYAFTKIAQELLALKYYRGQHNNVIVTRPFHTTGPRRPDRFVCSSLARQVALIEKGRQEAVISAGNINIMRDFTDVRDAANAYYLLLKKGISGEAYNICSGKAYSIKSILDILLSMTEVKVKLKVEKSKLRANDTPLLIGDYTKLRRATGWKPKISFDKTLKDTLDYWRKNA